MLDLKELERKIDEMIERDTPEEMMDWLIKKRMNKFANIISEGTVESLSGNINTRFCNPLSSNKTKNKEAFIDMPRTSSLAA